MRSELPVGTVTFLFTDVEGSTRLLHDLGAEAYAHALAEHRRVIREACACEGGVEVDTQGDAFFFAFPTALGALEAASAFTDALSSGPLRVRVGLHTGTPLLTEEGYVGDDVHLAARIAASGHGGQILVSQPAAALLEPSNSLLQGDLLRDLGEHWLKDIAEPVSLFQLGEGSFPPLKTISNTNLPRPASSFVGRERELEEVLSKIEQGARLLTLTGPGGSGKTRLALEAATTLVPEYKAGVFWVGLASLRDPALVIETIAQVLGAKEGLAVHISERELLLLLDNLEQVVECAPELSALLESCPSLTLLCTSRELLRVRGELEYPVPPLAEPEAVELFCARAQLGPSEEIAELCARLDSLPLALELAAARTKSLTPSQILERLSQRLDLLRGGRDAEARQQTLRATIEWSYDLLSPQEQQLFARLAVFAGGCTLEAAEQVADADLDTLQSLVEKSLLRFSDGRYWMLETVREYAGEQLERSGHGESLRRRHAGHFLALAEEAQPRLVARGQEEWLGRIDVERHNVRAALDWALGGADAELGVRIAAALGRFWWVRGSAEGLGWLERGLKQPGVAPTVRAAAFDAAGGTAWFVGDHERALFLFEEGLATVSELGDRAGTARMLARLGPPLAQAGRLEEAERVVEEAVPVQRELGELGELCMSLHILGALASERGDLLAAGELLEESAELARQTGDSWQLSWDLLALAEVALELNDAPGARRLGCEALSLAHEIGDGLGARLCFSVLSIAAARRGVPKQAGMLWGAMERLDREVGRVGTMWRSSLSEYEEMLGERGHEFEQGRNEGRRLTLDEAVEYALSPID